MRKWIDAHWGDLLALHMIYLGLLLIYLAHGDTDLSHVGESFILSGGMTLRFKVSQALEIPKQEKA